MCRHFSETHLSIHLEGVFNSEHPYAIGDCNSAVYSSLARERANPRRGNNGEVMVTVPDALLRHRTRSRERMTGGHRGRTNKGRRKSTPVGDIYRSGDSPARGRGRKRGHGSSADWRVIGLQGSGAIAIGRHWQAKSRAGWIAGELRGNQGCIGRVAKNRDS